MQLDFTNFMSIIELISGLKFFEHRSYVDVYLKAYYYPMEHFEEWVEAQKNLGIYSKKQLINLIMCVCSGNKRIKQKLLTSLENLNSSSTT